MRVKDIISKVKIKLKTLELQNRGDYFTDEEILAFVNDAQNDILINHYPAEDIYQIQISNPQIGEYQLPTYVGRIKKVLNNLGNEYEYVTPDKIVSINTFYVPVYSLINNNLRVKPIPLPNGINQLYIYFYYSSMPNKTNLINQDIFVPQYYDKAIEYYALSQILVGDLSVHYYSLYKQELAEKAGVFYTRTEKPKIDSSW